MISRTIHRSKQAPVMISHVIRRIKHLRQTAVVAAAPAMISRTIHRSKQAPAMISRGTIYLCRLRHTAVAEAAPAMISRARRRSIVVVIVIVRNRSYDATVAATVQHCRRSSSQPHAPSLALSGTRGTTAVTVQRRRSSQPHGPSLALAGTRGTLAAVDRRWMLDLRIILRRGKRSGMFVWTTEQSNNGLRRR